MKRIVLTVIAITGILLLAGCPDPNVTTPTTYAVTVSPSGAATGESVSADVSEAAEGTTVTLTASLNSGRQVTLSASGVTISPSTISSDGGTATFTMPAAAVEVTANFSAIYTYAVSPSQTDAQYSTNDKSHFIVINTKNNLNKLMLFVGGSFSSPDDYNFITIHAASIGFDVISISYPNNIPAASLASSDDQYAFDNYRDEICFGNQVSNDVEVDILNSINTRTIKLIQYLESTYPEQNWNQYLTTSDNIDWEKIVVAGHSQGAGHACYLGKKRLVERVIMFSGPNDYSTHFNSPANWLSDDGLTELSKQYALLHINDEIISFDFQVLNLKDLGILTSSEEPLLVDDLSSPYNNKNALSLDIPAFSNHSSTVGGNPKLPNIWTYLLTTE